MNVIIRSAYMLMQYRGRYDAMKPLKGKDDIYPLLDQVHA